MNASLKSTVLLLASLSSPLVSRGLAAEEHRDGKHVRQGPAVVHQNAPVQNAPVQHAPVAKGPQIQSGNPSTPQAAGTPANAHRQHSQQPGPTRPAFTPRAPALDFNHAGGQQNTRGNFGRNVQHGNATPNQGSAVLPPASGVNVRKPATNMPLQDPPSSDKPKQITTVPGRAGNKAIDLSKRPIDLSKPVDLSKKPIDLYKKPGDLSDKVGKQIDPGFNASRLPKLESHPNDKAVKPPTNLHNPKGSGNGPAQPQTLAEGHKLHIARPGSALAERLKKGDLHRLVDSNVGKQVNLKKQFELHQTGDLARRMNLGQQLSLRGGWDRRLRGPIDPLYGRHGVSACYAGPSFFPGFCWFPQWSPWVNWCWNFNCLPICDPRPIFCRPIFCDPCIAWGGWDYYPVWTPMPVVTCGTWVDVPTVVVNAGYDVQLLATRFVDPGHPEQQLGPRYRVWLRNNSPVAIEQPFNVLAYASNDRDPAIGLPEAGVRIQRIEAGQIQSIDLRLPFEANTLSRDAEGHKVPFQFLHVIADSHREVPEAFEENNGAVLARGDILPVDPAVFAADSEQLVSGSVINVAGEGFGPEPGQVLVNVGGVERQAEIVGWYDLGVQVRLPGLTLASDAPAELVVVRGDQAASNPLTVSLSAAGNVAQTTALQSP